MDEWTDGQTERPVNLPETARIKAELLPYSERQTDGRMDGRTDRETSQST